MKRDIVASAAVIPPAGRRRRIESEPLAANLAALVREASADGGETLVWDFFEAGERMTYAELWPRVAALAAGLRRIGVGRADHVAVMLPNVAAFPLSWLAIATLGAVMVPMNDGYTEREIAYVLSDSEARWLIVHESCLDRVERVIAAGTVGLDPRRIVVAGAPRPDHHGLDDLLATPLDGFSPPDDVGHDDLLNIQYTSGTTGFPKGCMQPQRYWLNAGKVNAFRDGRRYRRILASTPFYYMDPQWLLLMAIHQRATLYVAARQSASRFMHWVREHRIEFCLLPALTLKQPAHPDDRRNDIIRANVYGLPRHLHAVIEERFDLCAREAFGMTEIGPTLYMPIEETAMVGSASCGIPCPFRECRIADEQGNTLPPGTVGELLVRGPGIFRGYYRKPEATAAAFHGDWFRTGDLFTMDERGYFSIVGRIKDVIRRSGENIAAREVESVLMSFDAVSEAACVPVADEVRGEEIKALIVWRDGPDVGLAPLEALIEHCRRNLASFKVPRYFESRSTLPKTSSMKIAKHLLLSEAGPAGPVHDRLAGQGKGPANG
ncbi:MAG: AMP-binding protein [Rhizobiales bacterium]|nr:AMP-binding protein [Hyphomicrobiales bacterium]